MDLRFWRRGWRSEKLVPSADSDFCRRSLRSRELRPLVQREGRQLRERGTQGRGDGTAGWTGEGEPALLLLLLLGDGGLGCVFRHCVEVLVGTRVGVGVGVLHAGLTQGEDEAVKCGECGRLQATDSVHFAGNV